MLDDTDALARDQASPFSRQSKPVHGRRWPIARPRSLDVLVDPRGKPLAHRCHRL